MKYVILLMLLAGASFLSFGQTSNRSIAESKCNLSRAQAPEIRGIRLGMTAEQLLGLFPDDLNRGIIADAVKVSKRVNSYGVGRFDLRAVKESPNPRLTGVNYITVELLDDRVTSFHVGYAGPEWNTADQFVAKLSEALHLPNSWEPAGESQQSLKCDGFEVNAFAVRGSRDNWVNVRDTSAYRVVEDRRQLEKEKERQAFRP